MLLDSLLLMSDSGLKMTEKDVLFTVVQASVILAAPTNQIDSIVPFTILCVCNGTASIAMKGVPWSI